MVIDIKTVKGAEFLPASARPCLNTIVHYTPACLCSECVMTLERPVRSISLTASRSSLCMWTLGSR